MCYLMGGVTLRVAVDDVELQVWDEGGVESPVVLLLHGIPTRNVLWQGVIPHLAAAGLRAVAPDLAGFGCSEAPPDVSIHVANQAGWMLSLLDTLAIERCLIVGHDIGSGVAQIMAVRAPQRVRGLVLMDGVYGDSWPVEAMSKIANWDPARASRLFELLAERIPATGTTTGVSKEAMHALLAPYAGHAGGLRLIRMAQSLDNQHTLAVIEPLRRQHPPCLLVWGDADRYQTVDAVARPLADLLGAPLELLPGGHFLPLDRPAEVAQHIIQFAATLP